MTNGDAGGHPSDGLQISISTRTCAILLGTVILLLIALGTSSKLAVLWGGDGVPNGLREISTRFDLDGENTLPSWFSSMQLLLASSLLALIASHIHQAGKRFFLHWLVLSCCFLYLSLDESAVLHEISIVPLRRWLGTSGIFYFAWVVPATIFVTLFGAAYIRFLLELPRRTRNLFIVSGCTFVGGALGCEFVGGAIADSQGFDTYAYIATMTIEESFEMIGIAVFVTSLLDYLSREVVQVHATIRPPFGTRTVDSVRNSSTELAVGISPRVLG